MAHEITRNDGLVLTGKPAWHGLGTVVQDAPTPLEALQLAKLNWRVNRMPVQVQNMDLTMGEAPEYMGIRRADTNELFTIRGDGWEPIQNEALADFCYALGEPGVVKVESAGSIKGGRRVWFLLRGESVWVNPNDEVRTYLLVANGHDGTLAMTPKPTTTRVVCNNTLSAALGERCNVNIKIRHVGDVRTKLDDVKAALGIFSKTRESFAEATKVLAAKEMAREDLQRFWLDVYTQTVDEIPANPKTEAEKKRLTDAQAILGRWATNFDRDRQRTNGGANAWTAVNAVTEWFDHQKMVRGKDDQARRDARVFANVWGTSDEAKTKTAKMALALV